MLKYIKQTYRNLSEEWNNEDGYVQPIISFRGLLILIVVMIAVCVWSVLTV